MLPERSLSGCRGSTGVRRPQGPPPGAGLRRRILVLIPAPFLVLVAGPGCSGELPTPKTEPSPVGAPPASLAPGLRAALYRAGQTFLHAKPTEDKELIAALEKAQPGATQEVMFGAYQQLFAIEPNPPVLEWIPIEGLGAQAGSVVRVPDPPDVELTRVGLTRVDFERVSVALREAGVTRVERFGWPTSTLSP